MDSDREEHAKQADQCQSVIVWRCGYACGSRNGHEPPGVRVTCASHCPYCPAEAFYGHQLGQSVAECQVEGVLRVKSLFGCCQLGIHGSDTKRAVTPDRSRLVGVAGIEPATSWSQTKRPTAGPHPDAALIIRADILDDKDSYG